MHRRPRWPAERVYLLYSAATALLFGLIFTASAIYQVTLAHLDALQLVLVGTVLEFSIFLFEIPTGVVADVKSRRLSVIIGTVLVGCGFLLEGSWPSFLPILLAQVVWGLGVTFTSGALQAWISDEIGEEKAGAAFLRGAQFEQIGELIGIFPAIALSFWRVNVPILVGGGLFILLALLLVRVMPEEGFRPTPPDQRTTWQHMASTLRDGLSMLRRRPVLVTILGIGLFYGLYSEGFDRLWTPLLLERFTFPAQGTIPVLVWFGLINAGALLISMLANAWAQRRIDLARSSQLVRTFAASSAALVAGLAIFAVSRNLALTIGMFWSVSMLRRLNYPLYTAWVNQRLEPQVRATVISLSSLVDALGQIVAGPLVGLLARETSLQNGILASAALLSPVLLLFFRARKEEKPQDRQDIQDGKSIN
ncbi:MFS transporter [Longilinea arvoryzae]|uniref:MFS transporter n=1 Tax=Longilinea arvoryzae TaxID=360412 RepID=UPI001F2060E1|nr:MFS transporter [Longilinea arvoryzae]